MRDELNRLAEQADRAEELARRLVRSGPKAAHVSASETHEISEWIIDAAPVLRTLAARAQGVPEGFAMLNIEEVRTLCKVLSHVKNDVAVAVGRTLRDMLAAPAPDPVPVAVPDAAQAKRDAAHSRLVAYGRELIASDARGEAADWRGEYAELMARKPDGVELPDAAQAKGEAVDSVRAMNESDRVPDDYRNQAAGYRAGWNDRHAIANPAQHAPTGAQVVSDETALKLVYELARVGLLNNGNREYEEDIAAAKDALTATLTAAEGNSHD